MATSDKDKKENILIRRFLLEDSHAVHLLWSNSFPNDPPWNEPNDIIMRKAQWQRDLFLVGEREGRIVATVLGGYDGFRGWIYHLAVDAEWRNKGIGRQMMEAIESRLKDLGCPKINLQVRSNNQEVVEFYKHIGYDIEDHTSMGKLLTG
jgi:ribosomal protein S18 acetylase RimI-like enzyme